MTITVMSSNVWPKVLVFRHGFIVEPVIVIRAMPVDSNTFFYKQFFFSLTWCSVFHLDILARGGQSRVLGV